MIFRPPRILPCTIQCEVAAGTHNSSETYANVRCSILTVDREFAPSHIVRFSCILCTHLCHYIGQYTTLPHMTQHGNDLITWRLTFCSKMLLITYDCHVTLHNASQCFHNISNPICANKWAPLVALLAQLYMHICICDSLFLLSCSKRMCTIQYIQLK